MISAEHAYVHSGSGTGPVSSMTTAVLTPVGKFTWERQLRSLNIPSMTKSVARCISGYANADGTRAFMGIFRLSEDMNKSERFIQDHIKRLRDDLGLIHRIARGSVGNKHHWCDEYILTIPSDLPERIARLAATGVKGVTRRCSREECTRVHHATGFCRRHYNQVRRRKLRCTAETGPSPAAAGTPCTAPQAAVSGKRSPNDTPTFRSKPVVTCGNRLYQACHKPFNTGPMDMAPRRAATSGLGEISRHSREEIIDSIRWAVIGTLGADIDAQLTDEDIVCLWKHKGIKSRRTTDVTSLFRHIFTSGADIGKMLGKARGLYDGTWDDGLDVPQARATR